jgi:hypothetical protein
MKPEKVLVIVASAFTLVAVNLSAMVALWLG